MELKFDVIKGQKFEVGFGQELGYSCERSRKRGYVCNGRLC